MILCSYAYKLWWKHVYWPIGLNAHMLRHFYDCMLLCSHVLLFTCLDDSMLPCLHAFIIAYPLACMPSSLNAWTLWWLPTSMLKCFNDCMLIYIDIHLFEIHTHVHTCGSWNVYWLGGISECVVGCTHAQMLRRFCLNDEDIRKLEVCVLGCLNTHMLVCSHG